MINEHQLYPKKKKKKKNKKKEKQEKRIEKGQIKIGIDKKEKRGKNGRERRGKKKDGRFKKKNGRGYSRWGSPLKDEITDCRNIY